jgi:N-dimethylarginine dimethylaminohydrolase
LDSLPYLPKEIEELKDTSPYHHDFKHEVSEDAKTQHQDLPEEQLPQ